jgi:hypothetical protein
MKTLTTQATEPCCQPTKVGVLQKESGWSPRGIQKHHNKETTPKGDDVTGTSSSQASFRSVQLRTPTYPHQSEGHGGAPPQLRDDDPPPRSTPTAKGETCWGSKLVIEATLHAISPSSMEGSATARQLYDTHRRSRWHHHTHNIP